MGARTHLEDGLDGGLVPAGEAAARVEGLELRGDHHLIFPLDALVARAVEARHLVVVRALELDVQLARACMRAVGGVVVMVKMSRSGGVWVCGRVGWWLTQSKHAHGPTGSGAAKVNVSVCSFRSLFMLTSSMVSPSAVMKLALLMSSSCNVFD